MRPTLAVLAPVVLSLAVGFGAARLRADDSAPAPAAPAPSGKEDKVRRLLVLNGSEKVAQQAFDKMLSQFEKMRELPPGFAAKFREKTSMKDMLDLQVPIMAKHLDDATLDGAIAFYESPAGQRYAAEIPAITSEAIDAGTAWGRKLGQEVAQELAEGRKPAKPDQPK